MAFVTNVWQGVRPGSGGPQVLCTITQGVERPVLRTGRSGFGIRRPR